MTSAALMSAVMVICTLTAFPLPSGVPLTLQTFGAAMCGAMLGSAWGCGAVTGYIMLGLVGLPVFTGMRGGADVLAGPTGGFIIGFLPLAAMSGAASGCEKKLSRVMISGVGVVCCHAVGIIHYSIVTGASLWAGFIGVSLPYFIKDLIMACLARNLSVRVKMRLIRHSDN